MISGRTKPKKETKPKSQTSPNHGQPNKTIPCFNPKPPNLSLSRQGQALLAGRPCLRGQLRSGWDARTGCDDRKRWHEEGLTGDWFRGRRGEYGHWLRCLYVNYSCQNSIQNLFQACLKMVSRPALFLHRLHLKSFQSCLNRQIFLGLFDSISLFFVKMGACMVLIDLAYMITHARLVLIHVRNNFEGSCQSCHLPPRPFQPSVLGWPWTSYVLLICASSPMDFKVWLSTPGRSVEKWALRQGLSGPWPFSFT